MRSDRWVCSSWATSGVYMSRSTRCQSIPPVVLDSELREPGGLFVGEARDQPQGHVDAGRHAGGRDEPTVFDPTLWHVPCAERLRMR